MERSKLLEMLNKFTRREMSDEEVYIFGVTLCDNEIDRDNERFSRKALEQMAEKFIGVTGIFDHDPKGGNQTARLFHAEVAEEDRDCTAGEKYACLKGYAYMVRTASNADLISEIEGGIKKEVSVSCAAERHVCSVCGADRREKPCRHVKGRRYDGVRCYVTLEDISDAYEWSFVAVPAQVCAGVTKKFGENSAEDVPQSAEEDVPQSTEEDVPKTPDNGDAERRSELEGRIRRALVLKGEKCGAADIFEKVRAMLELSELEELAKTLAVGKGMKPPADNSDYMM